MQGKRPSWVWPDRTCGAIGRKAHFCALHRSIGGTCSGCSCNVPPRLGTGMNALVFIGPFQLLGCWKSPRRKGWMVA